MSDRAQRRLAAVIAADIAGYSRLMRLDEEATMAAWWSYRRDVIDPSIDRFGGRIVKLTGDGFLAEFPSATDAVTAGIAMQAVINARSAETPDDRRVLFRMGINLGDILWDDEDIYGDGVNIAARIEALADPGGILISASVHDQVRHRVAAGFEDLGEQELKNIDAPVRVYRVVDPGLAAENEADRGEPDVAAGPSGAAGFEASGGPARDRPARRNLPVVAIEQVAVSGANEEALEAAADLHDQLLERFSRRTGIRVMDAAEGNAEKAEYRLKGRLRLSSAGHRLTMSMILQSDGRIFWSDTYEFAEDDLFAFVDQAARRIDVELRQMINKLDGERFGQLPDDELSASELRTRAANSFYEMSIASYTRSVDLLDRAIALEPDNPMGLAMWAHAWTWLCGTKFEDPDPDLVSRITARSEMASQAMPESDFVGKARVDELLKISRDAGAARRALSRVSKVNPTYAFFKVEEIEVALAHGEWDAADKLAVTFQDEYPRDIQVGYSHYLRAVAQLMMADPAGAISSMDEAMELRPGSRLFRAMPVVIHRRSGDAEGEARARGWLARVPREIDIFSQRVVLPPDDMELMLDLARIASARDD